LFSKKISTGSMYDVMTGDFEAASFIDIFISIEKIFIDLFFILTRPNVV